MRYQLVLISLALIFSIVLGIENTQSKIAKVDEYNNNIPLSNADTYIEDENPLETSHENALRATSNADANDTTETAINGRQMHILSGFVIGIGCIAILVLAFVFKQQRGRKQMQGMS